MSPQELAWLSRDAYEYALQRVATFGAANAYAKWYVQQYGNMDYETAPYQRQAFTAWQAGQAGAWSWNEKGFGRVAPGE